MRDRGDWDGGCFDHRFDHNGFRFDHRFGDHGFLFNRGGALIIVL
ncbi:hypothetical protein [Streptomyces mirabilis]